MTRNVDVIQYLFKQMCNSLTKNFLIKNDAAWRQIQWQLITISVYNTELNLLNKNFKQKFLNLQNGSPFFSFYFFLKFRDLRVSEIPSNFFRDGHHMRIVFSYYHHCNIRQPPLE